MCDRLLFIDLTNCVVDLCQDAYSDEFDSCEDDKDYVSKRGKERRQMNNGLNGSLSSLDFSKLLRSIRPELANKVNNIIILTILYIYTFCCLILSVQHFDLVCI